MIQDLVSQPSDNKLKFKSSFEISSSKFQEGIEFTNQVVLEQLGLSSKFSVPIKLSDGVDTGRFQLEVSFNVKSLIVDIPTPV